MGMKPFAVAPLLLLAGLGLSGCAQTKDCRTASQREECPDSLVSAARQRLEKLSPQHAQKADVKSDSMANARRELAPDFARRSPGSPYSNATTGAAHGWN